MSIIPDQPSELILTESRTMRAQTIERTDVFDKVKALALLPDGAHATTEIVAGYYEVGVETIKSLVKDHRAELAENGLRVLAGEELRSFKDLCHIESRARSLA
ncbi:restriction endonuclease, partial [Streptomyces sp. NPDC055366]